MGWAGLVLAVFAYLVLHYFAIKEPVAPSGSTQLSDILVSTVLHMFAVVGQYLVSFAFLIGSGLSAFNAYKRRGLMSKMSAALSSSDFTPPTLSKREVLIASVEKSPSILSMLNDMTWREFEMLVGEAFRRKGYDVRETGGVADGGVDVVLKKDGEKYLVQCKQWKALQVGVPIVRELYGVMAAEGAAGGYVVTSGSFSEPAKDFSKGRNIFLIDGRELAELIRGVSVKKAERKESAVEVAPICLVCGSPMIKRVAQRTTHRGKQFWGCINFPKCRGIIAID